MTLRVVLQGILLYFMLTGTLPFDHLTHNEMADRRQVLGASALLEETWDHISGDSPALCVSALPLALKRYVHSQRAQRIWCGKCCATTLLGG